MSGRGRTNRRDTAQRPAFGRGGRAWPLLAAAACLAATAAFGATTAPVPDSTTPSPLPTPGIETAEAASTGATSEAAPPLAPELDVDTPAGMLLEEPIPRDAPEKTPGELAREQLMEISCDDKDELPDSWLDRTHSYLNQRLCEPAAWFDGFFGDERALEETPVGTFFRLRNELRWDESENFRVRVRLSANISLPGASDRLRLLLTRDEDVRGEFEPYLPVEQSDKQTRIGLRYNLSEELRSRLDVDATVKVNLNSLKPVLRGRYRQVEQLTDNSFGRFTQILFWQGGDGFGTTSRGDLEWYHDYDTQLRLSAQGTWSEESEGLDWRTSITGFHQLDSKTAIRTELGTIGYTDPRFEAEEYFLNFRYRRSFLRPWLFYELQPERAWVLDEESGNRRGDWRFIVTFEIQFENEPAREEREERDHRRWRNWNNRERKDQPVSTAPAEPVP